MRIPIKAAEPLRPEARNRPPSVHVSLQIGWVLTLSRTPVYDAINSANRAPAMMKARPRTPPNGRLISPVVEPRSRRSSTNDSRADTVAKKPNTRSAQTPTDIGDQYLK